MEDALNDVLESPVCDTSATFTLPKSCLEARAVINVAFPTTMSRARTQATPAACYAPSTRPTVTNAGTTRFKKRLVFTANALKQHPIGLEEVNDGIWSLYFCRLLLGRIDERDYVIRP